MCVTLFVPYSVQLLSKPVNRSLPLYVSTA